VICLAFFTVWYEIAMPESKTQISAFDKSFSVVCVMIHLKIKHQISTNFIKFSEKFNMMRTNQWGRLHSNTILRMAFQGHRPLSRLEVSNNPRIKSMIAVPTELVNTIIDNFLMRDIENEINFVKGCHRRKITCKCVSITKLTYYANTGIQ